MSSSLSPRTLALALAHPRLRPHPTLILACARPHPRVPLALPVIIPGPVVRVWVISGTGTGHHPGSRGLPVMNPMYRVWAVFFESTLEARSDVSGLNAGHPTWQWR